MKGLPLIAAVGLGIQLGISAAVTHWFPRPHPDRIAWNTAKESALTRAAADDVLGSS
jgi:hypothetical protein